MRVENILIMRALEKRLKFNELFMQIMLMWREIDVLNWYKN